MMPVYVSFTHVQAGAVHGCLPNELVRLLTKHAQLGYQACIKVCIMQIFQTCVSKKTLF